MPAFPMPTCPYAYHVEAEGEALRAQWRVRKVPRRGRGRFLAATWNLANVGLQRRRDQRRGILLEMMGWFDLVAVQGVWDTCADVEDVSRLLGRGWRMLFSDIAVNGERMAYLYDSRRARLLEAAIHAIDPTPRVRIARLSPAAES